MKRAYSVLNIHDVRRDLTDDDDELVVIQGIASTPTADRIGDVVEPLGAQFKTPMPLLWQHDHQAPVGNVTFAKATKDGIPFTAQIPVIKEAGKLKERVDEAIQSLKYNLVSAVSIGFIPLEGAVEVIETGLKFLKWEWMELSLVTIPANSEAIVNVVRSLDQPATGHEKDPGDSGSVVKIIPLSKPKVQS